jgi:hypothetical protein
MQEVRIFAIFLGWNHCVGTIFAAFGWCGFSHGGFCFGRSLMGPSDPQSGNIVAFFNATPVPLYLALLHCIWLGTCNSWINTGRGWSRPTCTREKWGRLADENRKRAKTRRVPDMHRFWRKNKAHVPDVNRFAKKKVAWWVVYRTWIGSWV